MSTEELSKAYDLAEVESKWYKIWEERGYFHADVNSSKKPYTIVIPPPNVTGQLTMGHILNNTLQDILIRFEKLNGRETCWLPGTDHAGIATQRRNSRRTKGLRAMILDARSFWNASGRGRNNTAARSSSSCAPSERPATGSASVSQWTKASPPPSRNASSACTIKA